MFEQFIYRRVYFKTYFLKDFFLHFIDNPQEYFVIKKINFCIYKKKRLKCKIINVECA